MPTSRLRMWTGTSRMRRPRPAASIRISAAEKRSSTSRSRASASAVDRAIAVGAVGDLGVREQSDQPGEAADTEVARAAGVVVAAEKPRALHVVGLVGHDRADEGRQLGRVMLAVGVHRDHDLGAESRGDREAAAQRVALPEVAAVAADDRAGVACLGGGVVAAAVVDDDRGSRSSPQSVWGSVASTEPTDGPSSYAAMTTATNGAAPLTRGRGVAAQRLVDRGRSALPQPRSGERCCRGGGALGPLRPRRHRVPRRLAA